MSVVINTKPQALAPWLAQQLHALHQQSEIKGLPQSVGISDPNATGGLALAIALAHSLLCTKPLETGMSCGHCAQCGLLKAGNHTDFFTLLPEIMQADFVPEKEKKPSKIIRLPQVNAMLDAIQLSSQRGGNKVVLIYPADCLGTEAANALLKALEEPSAGVYFIVASEHWGQLLSTLRSRCVTTVLTSPSVQQRQAWLADQGIAYAQRWLELGAGRVDKAKTMALDPLWEPLLKAMRYLQLGGQIDAIDLAQLMSKSELTRVLEVLQLWMHDLLALKLGAPAVFFAKQSDALQALVGQMQLDPALGYVNTLSKLAQIGDHPLNARTQTEALLLEYKSLFN